jgi:hypothetical protein
MARPEDDARKQIDAALTLAGWAVQDPATVNLDAARGVAVREFPLAKGVDETEQTLCTQLVRTTRLRQAVLKHAFEGKLVPQDPNDEPASALLARLRAVEPAEPKRATRTRPRRAAPASEP